MTTKTHRQATDFLPAQCILASGATAVDGAIIGFFAWRAASWPDDLEPDGTFGIRDHHGFFKRRYIATMRRFLPWLYRHRGWSHYLLTGFVIALVPALLLRQLSPVLAADVFRGILIGHWGHWLQDASTISGAPHPLAPFIRRDVHLLPEGFRFNTNGPSDTVLRWAIVVTILVIAYLVARHHLSEVPWYDQRSSPS